MIIIIIIIYIGEPRPFIVIGKEEKKYLKKILLVPAARVDHARAKFFKVLLVSAFVCAYCESAFVHSRT